MQRAALRLGLSPISYVLSRLVRQKVLESCKCEFCNKCEHEVVEGKHELRDHVQRMNDEQFAIEINNRMAIANS